MVEASAGTGKTFALEELVLELALVERIPLQKILLVTFTEKATQELRTRLRSRLREIVDVAQSGKAWLGQEGSGSRWEIDAPRLEQLKAALLDFDAVPIYTIHGFCNRVLAENSFETQSLFDVELDKASKEMALEGVYEYWRERFVSVHPVLAAAASTQKVKPGDMADFFNGLPKTQEYELGFENETDFEAAGKVLISEFDKLKESWLEDRESYGYFVENCIRE